MKQDMQRTKPRYEPTRFMLPTSHYDKRKADRAVAFIQSLKHTKGVWAGKPFLLFPWQEQMPDDTTGTIVYIALGRMSTAASAATQTNTSLYLYPEHPMYRMINGVLTAVSQIAYEARLGAENAQETADNNAQSIQRLDQSVSGLSTQFNVFSSGIEATIEDHNEILSAMSFSTDGLKIQMSGSIYYTLTDDVGYHIYQNDKEIAAFSEGKGSMEQLQMGSIICRKTSKGGWVWTEGS